MLPNFQKSAKFTLGVEIELQIMDPETFDLVPQSEEILYAAHRQGLDRVKMEIHKSMLEVNSEISKDVKQCRKSLQSTFLELDDIVESFHLKLGFTGTHPFQCWEERIISSHARYEELHEKFQWLIKRMNIYGMHVHVGVKSGDRALAIGQALIQYLPHFLALSANSPYWKGTDTGMQSSRVNILDTFPFSGLPLNISKWKSFKNYCDTLHQVGAIKTFKDLYWYIRPNPFYGTVEVRVCDATSSLSEAMALTALIQCLVAKIDQELDEKSNKKWTNKHHWIAPENQWVAARDGLDGLIVVDFEGTRRKISDSILEVVDSLSEFAVKLNCYEELQFIRQMIQEGNGATKQRKIFKETGSLKEVAQSARDVFIKDLKKNSNRLMEVVDYGR